jgi:hypothetical protein
VRTGIYVRTGLSYGVYGKVDDGAQVSTCPRRMIPFIDVSTEYRALRYLLSASDKETITESGIPNLLFSSGSRKLCQAWPSVRAVFCSMAIASPGASANPAHLFPEEQMGL